MAIKTKESFIEKYLWQIILAIGLIFLLLYFYQFHGKLSSNSDEWDKFGSYAGGIFSGMAFLALIAEMRANKKEKKLQEARYLTEIEDLKKEKDEQDKRWKKEDFERTFFMMLEQFNRKLNSLEENQSLNYVYYKILESQNFIETRASLEYGKERNNYSEINQLFINLYRILKFIDNFNCLNTEDKRVYSSLLRSYLSRKLLVILGFHLCYRKGDPQYRGFICFIEKYNFFEHIGLSTLEMEFWKRYLYRLKNYLNDENGEGIFCIYSYMIAAKTSSISMPEEVEFHLDRTGALKNKLNSIINNRINGRQIDFNGRKSKYSACLQFIFLHLLANFNIAFGDNIEYKDVQKCYRKFIDKVKEFYPEYNI